MGVMGYNMGIVDIYTYIYNGNMGIMDNIVGISWN